MSLVVPHFAGHQDDVFLFAMLAALIATLAICLPIILAPALTRARKLKRTAIQLGAIACMALGVFAWQAATNINVLVHERPDVQAQIANKYGVKLTIAQADELIDGGRPEVFLPQRAVRAGLSPSCLTLRLVPLQRLIAHATVPSRYYGLELGGVPLLGGAVTPEQATPCIATSAAGAS